MLFQPPRRPVAVSGTGNSVAASAKTDNVAAASAHNKKESVEYPDCDNMSDVLYELGAETWVRFGSNGIGFLNHKNSYNPQVSALWISCIFECAASLNLCRAAWEIGRKLVLWPSWTRRCLVTWVSRVPARYMPECQCATTISLASLVSSSDKSRIWARQR